MTATARCNSCKQTWTVEVVQDSQGDGVWELPMIILSDEETQTKCPKCDSEDFELEEIEWADEEDD